MIIHEDYHVNTFISGKDVYLNFNKWKTEEINKLLIIGLSGSGKSTLGKKLAEQYDCSYIDTDKFRGNIWYTDKELKEESPYVYEYFKNVWDYGDRHNIKTMDPELRRKERTKFIYWLLDKPEKLIIEGGALEEVLWNDEELRHTYPIIFKGTSMVKSMGRMSWREFNRNTPGRKPIENLWWWGKWCTKYKKMSDQQNKLRDKIIDGFDMNNYEEIEET